MKKVFILLCLLVSGQAQASRLLEVEDYYSQKASDFIKLRYPKSAFSVYVKADAENSPQVRQPSSSRETLYLPYMDSINAQDVGFWDRQDISLSTLLTYLKSVVVTVDIDHSFKGEEAERFKEELFKYLKLSANYDRVDLNQRNWTETSLWREIRPFSLLVLPGLALALLALFFIFHTSINSLVKGLARPLGDIGKSAENVANSSQITHLGTQQPANWRMEGAEDRVSSQTVEKAKHDIARLVPLFENPTAELLYQLNHMGQNNPHAMGAIFKDIPVAQLRKLVAWAQGDWWRKALTEVTPLNSTALKFLDQLVHLQIRHSLTDVLKDSETEKLKCALARLETKDFGRLFKGKSFTDAHPVLNVLPQETMIEVGKYLYPGQWAELLEKKKTPHLSSNSVKKYYDEAIQIQPLLSEDKIASFFQDADLISLLNRSSTKDERDIYRAMPDSSWVKQNRMPFYQVFQKDDKILESLTANLPLEVWAMALVDCDRQECEKVFKFFTERQRFLMRNFKKKFEGKPNTLEAKIQAKLQIVNIVEQLEVTPVEEKVEKKNEVAA